MLLSKPAQAQTEEVKPVLIRLDIGAQTAQSDCDEGDFTPLGPLTREEAELAEAEQLPFRMFVPMLGAMCIDKSIYDQAVALPTSGNKVILPTLSGMQIGTEDGLRIAYSLDDLTAYNQALEEMQDIVLNQAPASSLGGFNKVLSVVQYTPSMEPIYDTGIVAGVNQTPDDLLRASGEFQWKERMRMLQTLKEMRSVSVGIFPKTTPLYRSDFYINRTPTTAAAVCPQFANSFLIEAEIVTIYPMPEMQTGGFVQKWWVVVKYPTSVLAECPALGVWNHLDAATTWGALSEPVKNGIDSALQRGSGLSYSAMVELLMPNGQVVEGEAAFTYFKVGTVIMLMIVVVSSAIAQPVNYIMTFAVDE